MDRLSFLFIMYFWPKASALGEMGHLEYEGLRCLHGFDFIAKLNLG